MINNFSGGETRQVAWTSLTDAEPIGVLDIGSNSIRLVVYERHARWLTPLHNEKASAALGRGVAATGRIAEEGIARALRAIRRFALIAKLMEVGTVHILATSAVRDAANGAEFAAAVKKIMGAPVRVLSGAEEAHFAALGVVAGMPDFKGVVGDLGGGSLEFSQVSDGTDSPGETYDLGAIRLQDDSEGLIEKSAAIARERLGQSAVLATQQNGVFCAIGGTWRALAKLHQTRTGYPLHMVQNYTIPVSEIIDLCERLVRSAQTKKSLTGMYSVGASRRDLLPFGAAVLWEVLKMGQFSSVVFSALGVREGFLYGLLDPSEQSVDPLLKAAWEMSHLRARSSEHAQELVAFTQKGLMAACGTEDKKSARLRIAACLLSDIGWRGHRDYRGEQSVNLVAYSSMIGIDHPGRAYLAEVLAVRYMGLKHESDSAHLFKLAGIEASAKARRLGALLRLAYTLSAGMPGVLPRARLVREGHTLVLELPEKTAFLAGDRVKVRLTQFSSIADVKSTSIRTVA